MLCLQCGYPSLSSPLLPPSLSRRCNPYSVPPLGGSSFWDFLGCPCLLHAGMPLNKAGCGWLARAHDEERPLPPDDEAEADRPNDVSLIVGLFVSKAENKTNQGKEVGKGEEGVNIGINVNIRGLGTWSCATINFLVCPKPRTYLSLGLSYEICLRRTPAQLFLPVQLMGGGCDGVPYLSIASREQFSPGVCICLC